MDTIQVRMAAIGTPSEIDFSLIQEHFTNDISKYYLDLDRDTTLAEQLEVRLFKVNPRPSQRLVLFCPWSRPEFKEIEESFTELIDCGRVCIVCPVSRGFPSTLSGVLRVRNYLKRPDVPDWATHMIAMSRVVRCAWQLWTEHPLDFSSDIITKMEKLIEKI